MEPNQQPHNKDPHVPAAQLSHATALKAARILLTQTEEFKNPKVYKPLGYTPRANFSKDSYRELIETHAKRIFDGGFEVAAEMEQCLQDLLRNRETDIAGRVIGAFALVLTGDYEIDQYFAEHVRRLIAQEAMRESWFDTEKIAPFLDQKRNEDGETRMEHARNIFAAMGNRSEVTPIRITNRTESFIRYLIGRGATTLLIDGEIRKVENETPWSAELESSLSAEFHQNEDDEYLERFRWWDLRKTSKGNELLAAIHNPEHDRASLMTIITQLRSSDPELAACQIGSRAFQNYTLMGYVKFRFSPIQLDQLDRPKSEIVKTISYMAMEAVRTELTCYTIQTEDPSDPVLVNLGTPKQQI